MDVADGELVELEESGSRVLILAALRRRAAPDAVLKAHLAAAAGVLADDIELVHDCPVCGARHGRPSVAYPTTPSGRAWFADVAVDAGAVVAVVGTRHPLGIAVESAALATGALIDEAAFHASERAALEAMDPARYALARATLWARKTALLRAVGHTDFIEPSRLALTVPGEDGGVGRIVRSVPELGTRWGEARLHDLSMPGNRAASVAVLARER